MRPAGGKYPGISSEVDRSLGDLESGESDEQEEIEEDYSFRSFDGKAALEAEIVSSNTPTPHSVWMELEGGKLGHKKTILRLFTDSSLDVDYHKSHDRLLRVRYFSIGGKSWDHSRLQHLYKSSRGDSEIFKLGDRFAAVICIEKRVSFAILQCTGLKSASQYVDQIPTAEISLPDSRYDVSGQILSLHPLIQETTNGKTLSWSWDSKYVVLDSVKPARTQQATTNRLRHLMFAFNGRLVLPLKSSQLSSILVRNLPSTITEGNTNSSTWVITETEMQRIQETLLERLHTDESSHTKIPLFGTVREGAFPYTAVIDLPGTLYLC